MFVAGDLLDFLLGKRDAEYLAVLAQLRQVAVIGATAVAQAIALRVEGDGGDDREVEATAGTIAKSISDGGTTGKRVSSLGGTLPFTREGMKRRVAPARVLVRA